MELIVKSIDFSIELIQIVAMNKQTGKVYIVSFSSETI